MDVLKVGAACLVVGFVAGALVMQNNFAWVKHVKADAAAKAKAAYAAVKGTKA